MYLCAKFTDHLDPQQDPVRIAIFASGGGSNARTLLERFATDDAGTVALLLSNNPRSGVFEFGPAFQVPVIYLPRQAYQDGAYLQQLLLAHGIELVVLAGYLKHLPDEVVQQFPERILNIHPSLLPKFGGKGMYGMKVHRAVVAAGEVHSGITIHYVNEVYDQGQIIFQKKLAVSPAWEAEDLQRAVLKLEHQFFPQVVAQRCHELRHP